MKKQTGFSLIELLVATGLGMVFLTITMRGFAQFEDTNRHAVANADAMNSGVSAIFAIEADASMAGWGMNDDVIIGCDMNKAIANNFALANSPRGGVNMTPAAPVIINSGTAAPDEISIYFGSSVFGPGFLKVISDVAADATTVTVDRAPFGFTKDAAAVIVGEKTGKCTLTKITSNPSALPAPPATQTLSIEQVPGVAYKGNEARIYSLGPAAELGFRTWSVSNGNLRIRATDLAGAEATPEAVTNNIVTLKALYGFDRSTTFDPATGTKVSEWSAVMLDADGDGVMGSAGDHRRIVAIRIGIIARGQTVEKPPATGNCTATTVAPKLFSTREPQGIATVELTPTVAVTGDAIDWRCYVYQTYETVVPLRNANWRAIPS